MLILITAVGKLTLIRAEINCCVMNYTISPVMYGFIWLMTLIWLYIKYFSWKFDISFTIHKFLQLKYGY